jgi:transmembrane sensor
MMKHDPYSLTELIRSEEFIAWVLHPNAVSDEHWRFFLEKFPEKRQTIESAREYVTLLAKDTGRHIPSARQSDKMWRVVESHMQDGSDDIASPERVVSGWRWIRVAASAAIILSIGSVSYWFYYKESMHRGMVVSTSSATRPDLIQRQNDTDKPMMILLSDGSSVVLQPGGYLSYSEGPGKNRREVTLTGKAFFEIVKDKNKPFFVYSYGLATKVLGTSFLVDASADSKDIKVEVRTGTVAVFSINDLGSDDKEAFLDKPELAGITLERDQKIAFSRIDGKISKSQAAKLPAATLDDVSMHDFFFDETPVQKVFEDLEKAYNVKIMYNRELLGDCPLNATLIGQPFKEKLEVICNAIDAQFAIAGDMVTVTGRGCK